MSRASEAREAEHAYRDQLHARATFDYDGRMRAAPPTKREAERFGGGRHTRGTSGLYDWFYELSSEEQARIRANWMAPRGFAVDELEEHMPINEWLSVTRRIDMSRAVARGRNIQRKRYGGLDPDKVLTSGHRLGDLHRAGRRRRTRVAEAVGLGRRPCHFFTDDDGVVHPIRSTCSHVRPLTRKQISEQYGEDEAF